MTGLEAIASRGHVRWGFIGCGDVTEVKSGPAFARIPDSSVSIVMRRDAAKARDYAERHAVPRWTTDAAAVIESDEVDAVYIATPPASHAEYALLVAAAGKPVYVEKPLARTLAEGEAMVAACAAAGVPLFVAYYRRALPRFELARELLHSGAIGKPGLVNLELRWRPPDGPESAGWRWDPEIAGDGLLLDLGSHGLDLLDHWFGPVAAAEGASARRLPWSRVTDEVVASLEFAGGVLGTASWSFASAVTYDQVTVTGSAGTLGVPVFAEGPVRLIGIDGRVADHHVEHPEHVQEPLIAMIVDELLGRADPSKRGRSTGESALRTQAVLERLLS